MKAFFFDLETLELSQIGQWPCFAKVCLLMFVFLIMLYLEYELGWGRSLSELKEKQHQCMALQQEVETALKEVNAANTEVSKDHVHQIKLALETVSRQLPVKHVEAKLLEHISEQALQCRLQIRAVKPEPEINKGFYVEHPLVLSLVGDFHGMGEFASRLASMSPIVTLQEYSLHYHSAKQVLDMRMLLKTYDTEQAVEKNDALVGEHAIDE